MRKLQHILVALPLVLVACGGEPKPAKAPEPVVGASDGATDMPAPPAKDATEAAQDPTKADHADKAEKAGPAGGMIAVAAMKFTPAKKGKADKSVEVKQDGSVVVDGKPFAKIAGDQVQDATGSTLVTVGVDGSLVGAGVKPGYKFQGDELTAESGAKVTVGDDGTISVAKDGKTEALGKFEGGAAAKRAALLVTTILLMPTADGKDAKAAKPADTKATTAPKK